MNVSSSTNAVNLSLQVTREVQNQMVKDGKAAVSLIRANEAVTGSDVAPAPDTSHEPARDHRVDVTA